VVLEALSCGVPVVAIEDPAYECVENGRNGFLVKKDKSIFASKILEIIKNKKLQEEFSANAFKTAERFSVRAMVDSLEGVYLKMLDKYNKESIGRIMKLNERSERIFVIHIAFWVAIIGVRTLIFFFYQLSDPYPTALIGSQTFYHSTAGLIMIFLGLSLLLKKRGMGLLSLLSLGFGAGWIADEAWSVLNTPTSAFDYWDYFNLVPILLLGIVPFFFSKTGMKDRPKFYITSKQQSHVNPKNPKVSVVIPAYNEEEFIGTTLKSLINQTYKNFELIVVDNNSSDQTADVARRYGARVVFEKKKGVASARQTGFFASKSDIIACTDADAVVPENWLEKIVSAYEKDKKLIAFGGLSALYSGPVTARAAGRYLFPFFWSIDRILSGGWNLAGFNMSVKRKAFKEIGGFRTDLTLGEDVDLAQRLRQKGKVSIDTNFLVYASGRRYRLGLIEGIMTYAPSWIMRVLFKQEKFLTFNPVRSETLSASKLKYVPIGITALFICALFYLARVKG
jgi:glycosyltransferase involved in cell wall biosynthesis